MKTNIDASFVEQLLKGYLPEQKDKVMQCVKYALFGGGKRIRPILLLKTYYAISGNIDDNVCRLACALECIHTYSLVHDDLPCMDNDDVRRGKPTCHVQFDQATAVLAGDALLNLATEISFGGDFSQNNYAKACKYLFTRSGVSGMIYGQCLDLFSDCANKNDLILIANHKTADLLRASIVCAGILGGVADGQIAILEQIATDLGIAYQIVDDVLDKEKNEQSFLNYLTLEQCFELVEKLNADIQNLCKQLPFDTQYLTAFASANTQRKA